MTAGEEEDVFMEIYLLDDHHILIRKEGKQQIWTLFQIEPIRTFPSAGKAKEFFSKHYYEMETGKIKNE